MQASFPHVYTTEVPGLDKSRTGSDAVKIGLWELTHAEQPLPILRKRNSRIDRIHPPVK